MNTHSVTSPKHSHNTKKNFNSSPPKQSACFKTLSNCLPVIQEKKSTEINNIFSEEETRFIENSGISKVSDIPKMETQEDFYRYFKHLPKTHQHIFRILQNWTMLECFPSQQFLADKVNASRVHVNRAIKDMVRLGLIIKHYRHRKTCIYFVPRIFKQTSKKDAISYNSKKRPFLPDVTQNVTPYPSGNNKYINSRDNRAKKLRKSEKFQSKKRTIIPKPPPLPPKVPKIQVIHERCPELGKTLTPENYWALSAFPEKILHEALDATYTYETLNEKPLRNAAAYLYKILLKNTEKHERDYTYFYMVKDYKNYKKAKENET